MILLANLFNISGWTLIILSFIFLYFYCSISGLLEIVIFLWISAKENQLFLVMIFFLDDDYFMNFYTFNLFRFFAGGRFGCFSKEVYSELVLSENSLGAWLCSFFSGELKKCNERHVYRKPKPFISSVTRSFGPSVHIPIGVE